MATEKSDYRIEQLLPKMRRLVSIDASAAERLARFVDDELTRAGGTVRSLSQEHRDLLGSTGVDGDQLAGFLAKQAADEKIVAGIPHDQRLIMECLYGRDNAVLAARYTDLQGQIRDGKVQAVR
jgi:hypothetical protein